MTSLKIDLASVTSSQGLRTLDKHLSYHSFIAGVKSASTDDLAVFKKLGKPPCEDTYKNVHRWYTHVASWYKNPPSDLPTGSLPMDETASKDEDDIDLFDYDDTEDDTLKKKMEAMKAEKCKKREAAKSSLVIHIEPASVDTDLDKVLQLVKDIKLKGLTWGAASTRIPLAYGIEKLQVSCTILDDLVNTNEIIELIEELGLDEKQREKKKALEEEDICDEDEVAGLVQSATIVSFNKL